jgi:hypothetical protein
MKLFFTFFFGLCAVPAFSQVGGRSNFEFADLATNARVAGLGGINISAPNPDLNMVLQNPSLLRSESHNFLHLNYVPYYAKINASSIIYGLDHGNKGRYGFGLQYMDYGTMEMTDEGGNVLGTFRPQEYCLSLATAHTIEIYSLGASLKYAYSRIGTSGSSAIMADIGGIFRHPEKDLSIGIVVKNAGLVIKKHHPDSKAATPFDVQAGVSFKPEHMPLRFSVTVHHLQRFDIIYQDPTQKGQVDLEGNEIEQKKTFADKLARHFVLGGELILSKNFNILFGYNYLRRRELRLQTKSGGAGFSLGFIAKIKSFEIGFSKAYYHVAGGTTYLSIATNLSRFSKKKKNNNELINGDN